MKIGLPLGVVFVNDLLDLILPKVLVLPVAKPWVTETLLVHFYWGAISIENITFNKAVSFISSSFFFVCDSDT